MAITGRIAPRANCLAARRHADRDTAVDWHRVAKHDA